MALLQGEEFVLIPASSLPQITGVYKAILSPNSLNPLVSSKESGNKLKGLWIYSINITRLYDEIPLNKDTTSFFIQYPFTVILDKILTMFTWDINLEQVKTHMWNVEMGKQQLVWWRKQ